MSTKADLKENVLAAKVEIALKWVLANRGPVLTVLGIFVAVLLIGSVFMIRRQELRNTTLTRLALAESLISQQQYDRGTQILQDIRAGATSGSILVQVAYQQGLASLGLKNYDQAAQYFSEAVDKSAGSPVRPLALSNLGFTYEQKKDFAAAAQAYGRFMTEYGEHFLAPRVQLALGRSLAADGKWEDAKKALTQLIDLYPTSTWAENARSIMDKNKTR